MSSTEQSINIDDHRKIVIRSVAVIIFRKTIAKVANNQLSVYFKAYPLNIFSGLCCRLAKYVIRLACKFLGSRLYTSGYRNEINQMKSLMTNLPRVDFGHIIVDNIFLPSRNMVQCKCEV